jgi:FMN-dependent NADH-azoreductase
MSKVLVITASVNPKGKSVSLEMVDRFLKYYKAKNPNDEFEILDLNKTKLGTTTLTVDNFDAY